MWLTSLLAHPLTRGMDIDSPQTTVLRRRIVLEKAFLRAIYEEWYDFLLEAVPEGPGRVLELGSGGGFLRQRLLELLTSDLMLHSDIDVLCRGESLPFRNDTLRAIVMSNVFHHIPNPEGFLCEAARCLVAGGVVAMIEPWPTAWSRFVYRQLHHEPFDDRAKDWTFSRSGPLSQANAAMPWIAFRRDADRLRQRVPELRIELIEPFMPIRYLLSGGVSLRSLMPGWTHGLWRGIESVCPALRRGLAMFAGIILRKEDRVGEESAICPR